MIQKNGPTVANLPGSDVLPSRSQLAGMTLGSLFVFLLLMTLAAGAGVLRFGDLDAAIAWWNGFVVYPAASPMDIGTLLAGHQVEIPFQLKNLSETEVEVLGAQPDCSCTIAGGLPLTIPAGGTAEIPVVFTPSQSDVGKPLERNILLYLNKDSPPTSLRFRGEVTVDR